MAEKPASLIASIQPRLPALIDLAKKALQNYSRLDLTQALDHERLTQALCWSTEDRAEGMKSFLEKREPVFKGN